MENERSMHSSFMKLASLLLGLVLTLAVLPLLHAGAEEKSPIPMVTTQPAPFEVSLEEVTLKEYDGNVHPYVFQSSLLSLNWMPYKPIVILGEPFIWQWRGTFVADAIFKGPESVYLGFAPQFRVIAPLGKTPFALFLGGGGGCGWANANTANVSDGGLGEPFTFILMGSGGLRYTINRHWAAWLGIDYQHLSNAGLSDWHKQNIGLDSLGAMVGVGYTF